VVSVAARAHRTGLRSLDDLIESTLVLPTEFEADRSWRAVPARRLLSGITHFEWIYERVLGDPRVREINERFAFIVR
jgi:hypothetical protein